MRLLLVSWLLLISRFWLFGPVSSSRAQMDVGGKRVHWTSWQPWICLCNLNKQARSRHLVAWPASIALPLKASLEAKEFWEEKPCSLQECVTCEPEECPDSSERSGWGPPWERFLPVDPHDSEIPLPPSLDTESYDSLPVVDDMGEE
uniref:Uncharacterized protein n=1 Tax=Sphaerodactylus townsendi TaxID=933632 RepID=A0ACB8EF85_9SAUR